MTSVLHHIKVWPVIGHSAHFFLPSLWAHLLFCACVSFLMSDNKVPCENDFYRCSQAKLSGFERYAGCMCCQETHILFLWGQASGLSVCVCQVCKRERHPKQKGTAWTKAQDVNGHWCSRRKAQCRELEPRLGVWVKFIGMTLKEWLLQGYTARKWHRHDLN